MPAVARINRATTWKAMSMVWDPQYMVKTGTPRSERSPRFHERVDSCRFPADPQPSQHIRYRRSASSRIAVTVLSPMYGRREESRCAGG